MLPNKIEEKDSSFTIPGFHREEEKEKSIFGWNTKEPDDVYDTEDEADLNED